MKKHFSLLINNVRFRRWSRKNYAIFSGLHKIISIGQVSIDITEKSLQKNKKQIITSSDSLSVIYENDNDENETLFNELFLQLTSIQVVASPVIGDSKYTYLLTEG